MALPTVYEFKYKPSNTTGDKISFLLGTTASSSGSGSLNFYLHNNFDYVDTNLSFKGNEVTWNSYTQLLLKSEKDDEKKASIEIKGSESSITISADTMTLSAEKIQASTNKTGTQFSFTSTASTDVFEWIGAAEFGKSQNARVKLGSKYNTTTKQYEPWISGYNSSEEGANLYIVPGKNSFVYLGNPATANGSAARVSSTKLEIRRGTAWKQVAVKDDIPTPSFKYHIYAVFLNGDTDPSAYSVTNKYVFFTDIYTTKDPNTITKETIYSDLLSNMIWGTPMLRYNNPNSTSSYTNKTPGVLWNFDDSYTTSAAGDHYTGPAFTFKGLGDEDSETRINPRVVEIKYEKVRVN